MGTHYFVVSDELRTGYCFCLSFENLCGRTGMLAFPGQIMNERSNLHSVLSSAGERAARLKCPGEFLGGLVALLEVLGELLELSWIHASWSLTGTSWRALGHLWRPWASFWSALGGFWRGLRALWSLSSGLW